MVLIEFFAFNTKLPEMAMLVSKDFTAAKKLVGLDLVITGSKANAYSSELAWRV